jgi:cell division transport system permease protein
MSGLPMTEMTTEMTRRVVRLLRQAGLLAAPGAALALRRSGARLRLDWIVAAMAFLAALALVVELAIGEAAGRWRTTLTGTLTVEIPPAPSTGPGDGERLARVLEVLRAEPGIAAAAPLSRARVAELLAPWLGATDLAATLPVPQLVDVTRRPGTTLDLAGLGRRLADAAHGTVIDDHRRWLDELLRLARLATLIAAGIMVVVGLAATVAVITATRAGLALHHEAIDLLHLIGAEDRYVARAFTREALVLGLRGGGAGVVAAAGLLAVLGATGPAVDPRWLPQLWPKGPALGLLLLVPLAAGGLAAATAHWVVRWDLKKKM